MQTKESLTIKIVRWVFVTVVGTITILGSWVIDLYYDVQMWIFWFKLKH